MKHTSTFLCSLVLVLSSFLVEAQTQKTDSVAVPVKTNRFGIRVGIDLFKLTRSFYEKDYKGLEIVGDYRISKKYYLAGELGNEDKTVNDDQLNFTTKGTYFKAGFDYNLYENWLDMENMVYIGARYGVSSFSQTLNSYTIYNRYPYFGPSQEIVSGEKFTGLSAQWIEVLLGVKAKVINNFYVGFSFRMHKLVSNKKPERFDNLYIPGFNRTYDGTFGAGFNYTVSYLIPIYKKKVPLPPVKKK
ncbi:DUF6048 family protein [Flavobacterium sp.]|uniref:DUF6048 family protein n=1 Tax=Flavobacterium sp. TaxID=239 RepID=UPI002609304A|nr:DUF6048 family protein [Flavobacterium sp.]